MPSKVPEAEFVESALGDPRTAWSSEVVRILATRHVPDRVLDRRAPIVRADAFSQWAQWFIEGIANPLKYVRLGYAHLFKDVLSVVSQRFSTHTKPEQLEAARTIAAILMARVEALRMRRERRVLTREQRILLLDLAGQPPKCWACGFVFSRPAVDNFVRGERSAIPVPPFVDILKPIGLKQQDLRIEVDHVFPFAQGGAEEENLRLACGWCNRHKSSLISLYEVEGRPRQAGPSPLAIPSLPQPFWIVRILAVQRRCEHPDGCSASVDTSEMTVAPISTMGTLNPCNLKVTCYGHDPWSAFRLQSVDVVRRLWQPVAG